MLHERSANAILLIVSRVAWWLLALVLSLLIGLAYSCTAYGYVVSAAAGDWFSPFRSFLPLL